MASSNNNQKCYRCDGTGIYRWGTVVNGVSTHQGTCWRCNGNGVEPERAKSAQAQEQVEQIERTKVSHETLMVSLNNIAMRTEKAAKHGTRADIVQMRRNLNTCVNLPEGHDFYAPSVYVHLLESMEKVERMRFA